MISLTFPDGSSREFSAGITGAEIAEGISKSLAKKAVAMRVDGELRDLADPIKSDGRIEIDGTDLRRIRLHDLRKLIGYITQDAILFNDSIRNNLLLAKPDASEEELVWAARIANAHEFILAAEQGYDTVIGDRGLKLSGGQRQRLTIARAVLKNPPILILDEATSSLDSESEKLVQDALEKLTANRTSIIIAHRLSTVQHADEIAVLKAGRIIERGNHDQLMALDGEYRKLVALQAL